VFYELARNARSFVDAGADSGIYTLLACAANERLRAVAFEPNPHALRLLERNIEVNALTDRVVLERVAASDHRGQAILRVPDDETDASIFGDSGTPIRISLAPVDDVLPAEP
jgi:FkbM family methyltransferase